MNLYVIEGGINHWRELYPPPSCVAKQDTTIAAQGEQLAYRFNYAVGSALASAQPDVAAKTSVVPCFDELVDGHPVPWPTYTYASKVKLQVKKIVKGGCG